MSVLSQFPITGRWPPSDPGVIQLYAFPTQNGVKASIALEELGLPYEAHRVTLSDADVKSPEFLSLNPNNKIPAIIDPDGPGRGADRALGIRRDPDLPRGKDRQTSRYHRGGQVPDHQMADVPDGRRGTRCSVNSGSS
jgi:hypothetical protein